MPIFNFDRNKTFKPLKSHKNRTTRLHDFAKATLGSGNLRNAVALPPGESEDEWLATHLVDFYNEISLLYGTVSDFCTPESCPSMTAGATYEYLWADPPAVPKPINLSAPEYVDRLMSWIEAQISNEAIFPTSTDVPFPKGFKQNVVKNIFKRLFRVYAHIYHHHIDKVIEISAEAHLNTCFKHFILFCLTFDLVDKKELAPLESHINKLTDNALELGLAASAAAAAASSGGSSTSGAGRS